MNGVRPAADVTLQAVAPIWRERLLCVVLTGHGRTTPATAPGPSSIYGGTVIAQDAATATIYGMPAAVAEAGLSDRVLPLHRIAAAVAALVHRRQEVAARAGVRWTGRSEPAADPPALAS